MKNEIAVVVVIIALIAGVGIGYLGNTANHITKTTTSTVTNMSTQMVVSQKNYTITTTEVGLLLPSSLPSWNYTTLFLVSSYASLISVNGIAFAIPSINSNLSDAYVFNCATAAASSSGCTKQVVPSLTPSNSFNITVWYPYTNQSNEPSWANCMFKVAGKYDVAGYVGQSYAYCIRVGATAFIISIRGTPPP